MTASPGSGSRARRPKPTPRFSCILICRPWIGPFRRRGRDSKRDSKGTVRQWHGWSTRNGWVDRAAEHDSDLASRRRERRAKELERAQDDGVMLIRADLAKVAERIQGMNAKELTAGQIPAALKTLIELELKLLGYEDRVALTGKDGGPVKVEAKTEHIFQPTPELWDEVLRKRAEFERLRDGDTDEDTASDSL